MTFEEVKKIYERFLKEYGVFKRAIEIHSYGAFTSATKSPRMFVYPYKIAENYCPYTWIQSPSTFCVWSYTSEGDMFWWPISLLWQYECVKRNIFICQNGFLPRKESILMKMQDFLDNYDSINELHPSSIDRDTLLELKENIQKIIKQSEIEL